MNLTFQQMASPVYTELEVTMMNWLGKMLGLPEEFLNCSEGPGGGTIQVLIVDFQKYPNTLTYYIRLFIG